MSFEVIPAIDLRGGLCVRLLQGRYEDEKVYSDNPAGVAAEWVRQGAQRLHVVDLDGAKIGTMQNRSAIASIARAVNVPIQLGGGIRDEGTVDYLLNSGMERVIIGTRAMTDDHFVENLVARWGHRIVIGIDAKEGRVATRGWLEVAELTAVDMARRMEQLGALRLIFTDIGRDGALAGPNLSSLIAVLQAVTIPVIASGGVASASDVLALANVAGVEGVIVGKALYEGSVNLRQVLAFLKPDIPC